MTMSLMKHIKRGLRKYIEMAVLSCHVGGDVVYT